MVGERCGSAPLAHQHPGSGPPGADASGLAGKVAQALFFCSPDPLDEDAELPEEPVASFDPLEVSEPFEAPEPLASEPFASEPVADPPSFSDPLESFAPSDPSLDDPPDRLDAA